VRSTEQSEVEVHVGQLCQGALEIVFN